MLTNVRLSQIFVLDQDAALDFYVGKLGLEVKVDSDLGFMRWLTVGLPGDSVREILLELPGPPAMDGGPGLSRRIWWGSPGTPTVSQRMKPSGMSFLTSRPSLPT